MRVSFSSYSASAFVASDPVRNKQGERNRKWKGNYQPIKDSLQVHVTALEEKLTEAVRQFPVLYGKSCRDFKDNRKGLSQDFKFTSTFPF